MIDASAVMRLLLLGSEQVKQAVRDGGLIAPSIIVLEAANALVKEVRFAGLPHATARALFAWFHELRIDLVPDETLGEEALELAVGLGLSAYDAAYVVLAGQRRARLLTSDRRLADVSELAELIS